MAQESPADAPTPLAGAHVGMADQGHVLHVLDAHHPHQSSFLLHAPEHHARVHLMAQLLPGHVGLLPAVRGDHIAVGLGRVVDDFVHGLEVVFLAQADHGAHGSRTPVLRQEGRTPGIPPPPGKRPKPC